MDDQVTLYYIQKNLGIRRRKKEGTYITFEIIDFNQLYSVIIPIFSNYQLLTIKHLNFIKFKQAMDLKWVIYIQKKIIIS